VAISCEHGHGSECPIKGVEFLDYQRKYQLIKKGCAPWSQLVKEFRNYRIHF
jgi:hypothetical protein